MSPEEARRRAAERRKAFEASVDALSQRVGHSAELVEHALVKAKGVASAGQSFVEHNPKLFVIAAVGVGVALGAGPRRRALPSSTAAAAPARSFVGAAVSLFGRLLLKAAVSAAEKALEDRLGATRPRR